MSMTTAGAERARRKSGPKPWPGEWRQVGFTLELAELERLDERCEEEQMTRSVFLRRVLREVLTPKGKRPASGPTPSADS